MWRGTSTGHYSGGGKSTIVSMIERFYDPASGNVSLDGFDLKQFNVSYLRSIIGYVGQEPALFATTIRENIRYGCPGATHEQILAAAKMANAHDFISEFPLGYDTYVGDQGMNNRKPMQFSSFMASFVYQI